jgi:hypothetical protein
MPRVDLSTFGEKDLDPIFVGMSMADCARAERVLDALAIFMCLPVRRNTTGISSRRKVWRLV